MAADVIPYGMALSERANLGGLNLIGLKRRGIDKAAINGLRASFSEIFEGEGTLKERAQKAQDKYGENELVSDVVNFLLSDSARSFLLPKSDQ